jgi:hypothetical protein
MSTPFLVTQFGFVVTTFVFYGLLFYLLKGSLAKSDFSPDRKKSIYSGTVLTNAACTTVNSILTASGFFRDFGIFPPRLLIILLVPLVAGLVITVSGGTKRLLQFLPASAIIYLQSFRIIVEVLLWMAFEQGKLPIQLTFEGRNFDIISGITAPIVAFLLSKNLVSRGVVIVWNVVSLGLLINVVATAVLSLPTPFRVFMNEPANRIVAEFPVIWLPGLLVPLAYGLHFLSLRQLLIPKE